MSKAKGNWWVRIREGLVRDPDAPHYKKMGNALWVYLSLHMGADLETGELFRTYKTISNETGIPAPTVRKMMKKLEIGGYIKTVRLARGLHIQILKWVPVKKKKKASKSGRSLIGESVQNRKRECPNQNKVPESGHSLNGQNDESNHARVSITGRSNETHITRPNKKESLSPESESQSKAKAQRKTNPDIRKAINHYHAEFNRIHGFKPHVNGAACKTFQRLLEDDDRSLESVNKLTTDYLNLPDQKLKDKGYPVEWLPGNINGLLLQKKQPEQGFVF